MPGHRKVLLLGFGLLLLLAVIPGIAVAGHQFSDVPDSNIFHDDIAWLADNGITRGCNPPANTEFCPGDNVRRETMAAFMRRLAGSRAVDAGLFDGLDSTAFQSRAGATLVNSASVGGVGVAIATITGFSVPTSSGVIVGSGNATFLGDTGPDVGLLWVVVDGSCTDAVPQSAGWWQTFDAQLSETSSASVTKAVTAGSHRIDLCAVGFDDLTDVMSGSLSAQWAEKAQGATTAGADGGEDLRLRLVELHAQLANE